MTTICETNNSARNGRMFRTFNKGLSLSADDKSFVGQTLESGVIL